MAEPSLRLPEATARCLLERREQDVMDTDIVERMAALQHGLDELRGYL